MPFPIRLACPDCDDTFTADITLAVELLRDVGMLKKDKDPDPAIVFELLQTNLDRLACRFCDHEGLEQSIAADDDGWGDAKPCDACNKPIPWERLELFPNTTLCVACQQKDEAGELQDEPEFCPKCGALMVMRKSGSGITRYRMACGEGCR